MTVSLKFEDLNEAFEDLVGVFRGAEITNIPSYIAREKSRNGDVLSYTIPVAITYTKPWNRVLFNTERDCNPFFHLFEALWMLSGSNSVAPLDHFNSNMKNYSDDGRTFNGAYGYRWRHSNTAQPLSYDGAYPDAVKICGSQYYYDQLEILIEHLTMYPDSRRVVLQMWNVEDDLLKIDGQFDQYSKDVCCNTSIYFRIVKQDGVDRLNMTVMNRSNDLIWGMLGANYVHFTFLQEYMADRLGIAMGTYTHFTNNLHAYLDKFEGEKYLSFYGSTKYQEWLDYMEAENSDHALLSNLGANPYISMFEDVETKEDQVEFDELISEIVDSVTMNPSEWLKKYSMQEKSQKYPFFGELVIPAIAAFQCHKLRKYETAYSYCVNINHPHWEWACTEWIKQRKENWQTKQEIV